jgi:hypothetical protein
LFNPELQTQAIISYCVVVKVVADLAMTGCEKGEARQLEV